jgi:hypothetical protein
MLDEEVEVPFKFMLPKAWVASGSSLKPIDFPSEGIQLRSLFSWKTTHSAPLSIQTSSSDNHSRVISVLISYPWAFI